MTTSGSPLSVDSIWSRVRLTFEAEREALGTIALALLFLPQLVYGRLAATVPAPGAEPPAWLLAVNVVGILLALVAQLSITRIALDRRPQSVGQHLAASARLLPRALLVAMAPALGVLPLVLMLGAAAAARLSVLVVLLALLIIPLVVWLVVRLIAALPLLVMEAGGVRQSLVESWQLTRPHTARLLGSLLLFALGLFLVVLVVVGLATAVGAALGLATGARPEGGWGLAQWLVQLASALAFAGASLAFTLFVAELYRVLAGRA